MPSSNRILAVGAAVAAGLMIAGGAAAAQASTPDLPAATGYGQQGQGGHDQRGDGHGDGPRGQHTPVTGDEAAKVKAAVTAKDSAITVTEVVKEGDGSYDANGTKAGQPVHVEVSADLKTVEVRTGVPGRDGHGHGMRHHTPASAAETAQVTAAVKAKDASITVEHVMKDEDGSFHAMGLKAGRPVMVEVSTDLRTVTVGTGMPGRDGHGSGRHREGGDGQPGRQPGQAPTSGATGAPSGYTA